MSKSDESVNSVESVVYDYLDDMLRENTSDVDKGEPATVTPASSHSTDSPGEEPARAQQLDSKPIPKASKLATIDKPLKNPVLLNATLLKGTEIALPPGSGVDSEVSDHENDISSASPTLDEGLKSVVEPKKSAVDGRPHWASGQFECLIFNVAGLKLAVPLVSLGSIHQIDREFNALPGQDEWFLGILQTANSGNIKVLNTARWVMPERYDPAKRDTLEYVITIHGHPWGFACHGVEQSIKLSPDQVKWRGERGKRPWLAGTVLEYMCSLIDTDGFQNIISESEES